MGFRVDNPEWILRATFINVHCSPMPYIYSQGLITHREHAITSPLSDFLIFLLMLSTHMVLVGLFISYRFISASDSMTCISLYFNILGIIASFPRFTVSTYLKCSWHLYCDKIVAISRDWLMSWPASVYYSSLNDLFVSCWSWVHLMALWSLAFHVFSTGVLLLMLLSTVANILANVKKLYSRQIRQIWYAGRTQWQIYDKWAYECKRHSQWSQNDRQTFVCVRKHSWSFVWCFE